MDPTQIPNNPEGLGIIDCSGEGVTHYFPGNMSVYIRDKGVVKLQHLETRDQVRSNLDGGFSCIYDFEYCQKPMKAKFPQVYF